MKRFFVLGLLVMLQAPMANARYLKYFCESHSIHRLADGQLFDKVRIEINGGGMSWPDDDNYSPACSVLDENIFDDPFYQDSIQKEPGIYADICLQNDVPVIGIDFGFQEHRAVQRHVFTRPEPADFPFDSIYLEEDPTRVNYFYRCRYERGEGTGEF